MTRKEAFHTVVAAIATTIIVVVIIVTLNTPGLLVPVVNGILAGLIATLYRHLRGRRFIPSASLVGSILGVLLIWVVVLSFVPALRMAPFLIVYNPLQVVFHVGSQTGIQYLFTKYSNYLGY